MAMKHPEDCLCCAVGPDAALAEQRRIIKEFGHMVMGVGHGADQFAYTIGLWDQGLPEVILSGLPMRTATMIINLAVDVIKHDGLPAIGSVSDEIANLPAKFGAVTEAHALELMGGAFAWAHENGTTLPMMPSLDYLTPVVQIIWSDTEGNFPGDPDFDPRFKNCQQIFSRSVRHARN